MLFCLKMSCAVSRIFKGLQLKNFKYSNNDWFSDCIQFLALKYLKSIFFNLIGIKVINF
jgi:hypothetical protein